MFHSLVYLNFALFAIMLVSFEYFLCPFLIFKFMTTSHQFLESTLVSLLSICLSAHLFQLM